MTTEEDRESSIETAREVVKQRRAQTAWWTIGGALFFAALVLGGGIYLVRTARTTLDEVRCLVQRQSAADARERRSDARTDRLMARQHARLIALGIEIARREGTPTGGLEDLRAPSSTTSEREQGPDSGNGGNDGNDGNDPRDPPNPPSPRPRPSPDDPCLVKIGNRCIVPSPTPLTLAAAVDVKDAPRGCDARQ